MTSKKRINKIKDMAEVADASYAKLDYVYKYEKDEIYDSWFNIKRWQFADNIKLGYKKENGMPTAYALTIGARFSQDSYFNEKLINNDIQNFLIYNEEANQTEIAIDIDFFSTRTKNFVNRYELIEHQPNADYGFCATLFKDTKADSKDSEYISH